MELTGKYASCVVFSEAVEPSAISQITEFLNHSAFSGLKIRVMPDVHFGSGAVIGFTSTLGPQVIPNVIGVDIGCGVAAVNLGQADLDFSKVDAVIREHIPSGFLLRDQVPSGELLDRSHKFTGRLYRQLSEVCARTDQDVEKVKLGLGTLGGGNHFIEIGQDESGNKWLSVHSGSRGFGLRVANFHQNIAKSLNPFGELSFLEGSYAREYFSDLRVAQEYASVNRNFILLILCSVLRLKAQEFVESVHNYIDFDQGIVRKGAISAAYGERVVIPWNMRDGIILGIGKGNQEWNCSAPHGAGRLLSRSAARRELSLDAFEKSMAGVWSSCIGDSTLDESPAAYKSAVEIEPLLEPTITVTHRIKTLFNFKATGKR